MSKRVAIYARVSTDKQELRNQLRPLKEYARNNEWESSYVGKYKDIVSGKYIKKGSKTRI